MLRERYQHWHQQQDIEALRIAASFKAWLSTIVLAAVLIGVTQATDTTRTFFGTQALLVIPVAIVTLGYGTIGAFFIEKGKVDSRLIPFLSLINAATVTWFLTTLASCSTGPGRIVFAVLAVWVSLHQNQVLRASATGPFPVVATSLGLVAGVAFAPTNEHLTALLVVMPFNILAGVIVGKREIDLARHREETTKFQNALKAQQLLDQTSKLQMLTEALIDIVGRQHDVNNSLQPLGLNLEILESAVTKEQFAELRESAQTATKAYRRLLLQTNELFTYGKQTATDVIAPVPVSVHEVVSEMVRATSVRYPHVHWNIELDEPDIVLMSGGKTSLERIIENCLVNACEGDGRRGARTVTITSYRHHTGTKAVVEIIDDGPGFAQHLLDEELLMFRTTKKHGTGIGLYTVQKLVQASLGRLYRGNLEPGACVRIELPAGGPP